MATEKLHIRSVRPDSPRQSVASCRVAELQDARKTAIGTTSTTNTNYKIYESRNAFSATDKHSAWLLAVSSHFEKHYNFVLVLDYRSVLFTFYFFPFRCWYWTCSTNACYSSIESMANESNNNNNNKNENYEFVEYLSGRNDTVRFG